MNKEFFQRLFSKSKYMLLTFGLVGLGVALLYAEIAYSNSKTHIIEVGYDHSDYRFNFVQSKTWSEMSHGYIFGMEYDGEIENHTNSKITDWKIIIKLPKDCLLDSSWNGEFDLTDDTLTIRSTDFNDTIDPGEIQTVGFVLHSQIERSLLEARFEYYVQSHIYESKLFWLLMFIALVSLIIHLGFVIADYKTASLKKKQGEHLSIINQSLRTFANMIDAKDNYTKGHSQRVALYSRELARRMGLSDDEQTSIFYIALLHDVGKIGVRDAVLKKNAKLTFDEYNEVKEHVSMGGDILANFSAIPGIADGALYHHERFDGTGYVNGLKGKDIPLVARIICVADSFDAMSSARCYRTAMDLQYIKDELNKCSGKQFDPDIVPHMLEMVECGFAPINTKDIDDNLII